MSERRSRSPTSPPSSANRRVSPVQAAVTTTTYPHSAAARRAQSLSPPRGGVTRPTLRASASVAPGEAAHAFHVRPGGQGGGQSFDGGTPSLAQTSRAALRREATQKNLHAVDSPPEGNGGADEGQEAAVSKVSMGVQFSWAANNFYRQLLYPHLLPLPAIFSQNSEAGRHRRLFEALGLTEKEVALLYLYYEDIDSDASGSISRSELLSFLDIPSRYYFQRVFALFDEDGSGQVDFREFVLAVWNYASLPQASLIQFTFDLYDQDSSGVLDPREVEGIVRDCYGSTLRSNVAAQGISMALSDPTRDVGRGGFDLQAFSTFASRHAVLLMPAFVYQQRIRDRVGGEAFWRSCTAKRLQLSSGRYVSIQVLMKARMAPCIAANLERIDGDVPLSPALEFMKTMSETWTSKKTLRITSDAMELEDVHDEGNDDQQKQRRQTGGAAATAAGGGGGSSPMGGGGDEEKHLPRLIRGKTTSHGLGGGDEQQQKPQTLQLSKSLRATTRGTTIGSDSFAKSLRARDMTERIMEGCEPRSQTR